MIKTDVVSNNVLRITASEKLNADDFHQITPQVDSIISRYGKIRLLIDASAFNGWENVAAFENHAGFAKNHQQKAGLGGQGGVWDRPVSPFRRVDEF